MTIPKIEETGSIPTPPTNSLAGLTITEDNHNPQAPSPNAMMIDAPEEHIIEPNGTENEDVAIIKTDSLEGDARVLASDCQLPTRRHRSPSAKLTSYQMMQ